MTSLVCAGNDEFGVRGKDELDVRGNDALGAKARYFVMPPHVGALME